MKLQGDFGSLVFGLLVVSLVLALGLLFGGCVTGETGSRTIIGNHFSLPKLATPSGEVEFEIYESTEGASVLTRKNALVEITYSNHYTNTVLGVWHKRGEMALTVKVEPLQVSGGEADGQAEGAPEIAAEPAAPRNDGETDGGEAAEPSDSGSEAGSDPHMEEAQ